MFVFFVQNDCVISANVIKLFGEVVVLTVFIP